jgi:uncharacterized protein with HEPN domain
MKSRLGDKARLEHILDAITEIENFAQGMDLDNFLTNTLFQSAITRQIEIIGEAANKLSDDIKEYYNNIEWRSIAGFRNILIHEYFDVDYILVWNIIKIKIPELKLSIIKIFKGNLGELYVIFLYI